jgi:hypothetical protein
MDFVHDEKFVVSRLHPRPERRGLSLLRIKSEMAISLGKKRVKILMMLKKQSKKNGMLI